MSTLDNSFCTFYSLTREGAFSSIIDSHVAYHLLPTHHSSRLICSPYFLPIGGQHETTNRAAFSGIPDGDHDDDGDGQRERPGRAERERAEQRKWSGVDRSVERRYDHRRLLRHGDGEPGRRELRLLDRPRRNRGHEPDEGDLRLHRHIRQHDDGDYAG